MNLTLHKHRSLTERITSHNVNKSYVGQQNSLLQVNTRGASPCGGAKKGADRQTNHTNSLLLRVAKKQTETGRASVLEVTHACGDDGDAVFVAAVDCVGVTDAATRVGDGCNARLQDSATHTHDISISPESGHKSVRTAACMHA